MLASGTKVETGAGGGSHRVQIVFQIGFAPVAWRTGEGFGVSPK